MNISHILLFLFVGSNVLAAITEEDGNTYVDGILKNLYEYRELESMPLPDRVIPIFVRPLVQKIVIEVRLRDGKANGLHRLTRINDVEVNEDAYDSVIIRAYLNLKTIDFTYDGTFKFFNEEKNFHLSAFAETIDFILQLRINKETKEISVDNLNLDNFTGLKVKFVETGNAFQWIDNIFKSGLVNSLNKDLSEYIRTRLRYIFEQEVDKNPFKTTNFL